MTSKEILQSLKQPSSALRSGSLLMLWGVLIVHLSRWVTSYDAYLFDRLYQNDDARIILFPFWSFTDAPGMANDPIVQEQLGMTLTSYQLLCRFLLNFTDVLGTSKGIQFICFGLLFLGAYTLYKSRRTGLASAVVFVVLFLSTPFFLNRIGGGLPRGFAYPCMALWAAGALSRRIVIRRLAMVCAGLFYPPMMVLLLGSEGVLALRGLSTMGQRLFWKRARGYAISIVLCFGFFTPNFLMNDRSERMHTYEEAMKNPAFKKGGRVTPQEQIPFTDPAPIWSRSITKFFNPSGSAIFPDAQKRIKSHQSTFAICLIALAMMFIVFGLVRIPFVGISILASSLICYTIARVFAFVLYTPLRYLEFGTLFGTFICCVEIAGFAFYGSRLRHRKALRNLFSIGALSFMFLFLGDGFSPKTGMTISYHKYAKMWQAIEALPQGSRILGHPYDANSISLWGKKGTTVTYELLTPWRKERWERHQNGVRDIFSTLYATDKATFLKLCEKQDVTHIFKSRSRYGRNFKQWIKMFNPLNQQIKSLLKNTKYEDLLLVRVPPSAIIAKHGYELISVQKLKEAWEREAKRQPAPPPPTPKEDAAQDPTLQKVMPLPTKDR